MPTCLLVAVWPPTVSQSCYGVLHCSLGEGAANSDSLEGLEDSSEATEAKLTVPPDGKNYEAYDAIVVSEETYVGKLKGTRVGCLRSDWFRFLRQPCLVEGGSC